MENQKMFVRRSSGGSQRTTSKHIEKLNSFRDDKGRFISGNPGMKKGTTHKFTDLKRTFIEVFERIEQESTKKKSIDSFFDWATKNQKNQGLFYAMIARMLPASLDIPADTIIKVISAIPRPGKVVPAAVVKEKVEEEKPEEKPGEEEESGDG